MSEGVVIISDSDEELQPFSKRKADADTRVRKQLNLLIIWIEIQPGVECKV